jgi:hypothetical protein
LQSSTAKSFHSELRVLYKLLRVSAVTTRCQTSDGTGIFEIVKLAAAGGKMVEVPTLITAK